MIRSPGFFQKLLIINSLNKQNFLDNKKQFYPNRFKNKARKLASPRQW
jgi:hypothetical protein